ncbi:DNA methylase N-4/N-6 domain protein [Candidatus Symbiothrix dinenymphae]|nr:DNA methylase N-4/N-6 domain protein [Candidatus Symbiothrix dinenymphae]
MEKKEFTNTLYTNDNLFILNGLNSNLVDLIYLDPPFNSKRMYSAPVGSKAAGASFKDMWTWEDVNEAYLETLIDDYPAIEQYITSAGKIHGKAMSAYLTYMVQRIIEMHRILKDTGSLYLHCDTAASHYLKVLLDEIFGKNNFRNEIIWCYRGAGYPKNDFGRRHDIIFRYSKTETYTFNLDDVRDEYAEATKERFAHYIGNKRKGKDFGTQTLNPLGRQPDDWWQIQPIAPSAKERTGYPTQKPLALLHRIIKASSNEGDIVMDPFCGCATTCVAAQQLGRKWIGIDIEEQAVGILVERLSDDAGLFKNFTNTTIVPQRTDIQIIEPQTSIKERLYKKQNCLCNGCLKQFDSLNLEIDHIVPKAKGGGDYYENYQLLCGSCNRIKGSRPMEYLRLKIKRREEALKSNIIFGE